MAVTITSPQSAVLARNRFTLSWTCTYPQSAYEIMYRRRGETAWSTFGQVSSTAKSVTVDCSRFEDFVEYQYKVVVYSNYDNSVDISYSGSDASAGYALILVPESMVGTMKVKYGSGMIEVPLYSTTHSGTQLNIANNKKTGLIDPNNSSTSGSSAGSKLRVRDTPSTTKVAPGAYKYLSNPGVDRKTSLTSRYTYYSTSSTYKSTYNHTYYSIYYIPAYYAYTAEYYTLQTAVKYSTVHNETSIQQFYFVENFRYGHLLFPWNYITNFIWEYDYSVSSPNSEWIYNDMNMGVYYDHLYLGEEYFSVYINSSQHQVYCKTTRYATNEDLYLTARGLDKWAYPEIDVIGIFRYYQNTYYYYYSTIPAYYQYIAPKYYIQTLYSLYHTYYYYYNNHYYYSKIMN